MQELGKRGEQINIGRSIGLTHKLRKNEHIHRQALRDVPAIFVIFRCRHNCFGQRRWKLYLSYAVNDGVLLDYCLKKSFLKTEQSFIFIISAHFLKFAEFFVLMHYYLQG